MQCAPAVVAGCHLVGRGFAAIVLGYTDLARGGETLAPILLIAGYCIFIPIAILS